MILLKDDLYEEVWPGWENMLTGLLPWIVSDMLENYFLPLTYGMSIHKVLGLIPKAA